MWLERLGTWLERLGARHYTVGKARRWSLVYMIQKVRSLVRKAWSLKLYDAKLEANLSNHINQVPSPSLSNRIMPSSEPFEPSSEPFEPHDT